MDFLGTGQVSTDLELVLVELGQALLARRRAARPAPDVTFQAFEPAAASVTLASLGVAVNAGDSGSGGRHRQACGPYPARS